MRMRLDLAFLFVALLCGGLLPAASPAAAKGGSVPVDVELVLAVDVSFSMDPEEQRLQREGYFEALRSPFVLEAIRRGINGGSPSPMWNGPGARVRRSSRAGTSSRTVRTSSASSP